MSWDIFVQDLPPNAKSLSEIPADFVPQNLPITKSQVINAIKIVAPFADFSDPVRVTIESGDRCVLEVNLGSEETLRGFVFHVYGGDLSPAIVAEILRSLDLRALDPSSHSGIFEPEASTAGFERWQQYRSKVLGLDP